MAVDDGRADDNPAFDRGDQQTLVEFWADGSLQNPRRNNIDILEPAFRAGGPCPEIAAKKSDKYQYCRKCLHAPIVVTRNEQDKEKIEKDYGD